MLRAHVLDQGAVRADRRLDRRLHESRVAERLEGHPEDAVGKLLDRLGRELEREPRLPASAGPRECQQALGADQRTRLLELSLASDER